MKRAYLSSSASAIDSAPFATSSAASRLLNILLICSVALFTTACGPKKNLQTAKPKAQKTTAQLSKKPIFHASAVINDIMQQARNTGDVDTALQQLQLLQQSSPIPVKQEAAFRQVELLVEFQLPQAKQQAEHVLQSYPEHALVPYTQLWLAKWWYQQANLQASLQSMLQAMNHPLANSTLIEQILDFGANIANQAAEQNKQLQNVVIISEVTQDEYVQVQQLALQQEQNMRQQTKQLALTWFIKAAQLNPNRSDFWLRKAAEHLDLSTLQALHSQQIISPESDSELYAQFARRLLIAGDKASLSALQQSLAQSNPNMPLNQDIRSWIKGQAKAVRIGVLLPLSGKYKKYGEQALNGIRMFLQQQFEQDGDEQITLVIEDTNAENDIETAYKHLLAEQVQWVIGPLLSHNTEQLAPVLSKNIPVISLSSESGLAEQSSALFIHSLARNIQARFMARYAIQQGMQRMAIIRGVSNSEQREAAAFAKAFSDAGGEIAGVSDIYTNMVNYIHILRQLRSVSDDEELLLELDRDMHLFTAEKKLEIRMPVNIDGIYIALPGKRVAQLSGQLAYVDIRRVPLLGSNRWIDGHLLGDKGRYLSSARFTQPITVANNSSELLDMYRQIWGKSKPEPLFYIAYDTARIMTLLGSQLALSGYQAIQNLHDISGFPVESGHVRFNEQGIGEKNFDIYLIEQGKIKPAT